MGVPIGEKGTDDDDHHDNNNDNDDDNYIKYNFRAEQRVSSNLIGQALPYMKLYKPLQAVYITFSRPGY